MHTAQQQSAPDIDRSQHDNNATIHPGVQLVTFMHSIRTQANGVKFAHQSLCNPKISTMLKAVRRGFLQGCPNLSEKLILKYLIPSPATAKGHMKRPQHGIRSTRFNTPTTVAPPLPILLPQGEIPPRPYEHGVLHGIGHHVILDNDESIANVFCYGAFADKQSGVVYNDLTGSFPFVSYDGSVCFLVMYHYEANAILATPIAGLDDESIFNAYKQNFDKLMQKGFKPKLNVMDNQATRHIKTFSRRKIANYSSLSHTTTG